MTRRPDRTAPRSNPLRLVSVLALLAALTAGCVTVGGGGTASDSRQVTGGGGCNEPVHMAVSSEKLELLQRLAEDFNADGDVNGGGCIEVRSVASGGAAQLLADGWPDEAADGPRPAIWSPAASTWGAILNQRLAVKGQPAMAPEDATSFMLTPLVIAMPKPMAEALGHPKTPIGYSDLLALANDPGGWGSKGHREWGAFKLGKTNPQLSTSGLAATVAQSYAATGKTRDLSLEDLANPQVQAFNRSIESSVVHYGDITMTFLNNWFRNDVRGTALTYASAVAVEEKSVIDYNRGDPDGVRQPGEQPRPPKVPLVAVYPKEGTLFSDNPIYVLDAPWVTDEQRRVGEAFAKFVQRPSAQEQVLEYGFRPGNPKVAVGAPVTEKNGVDPSQPQTELGVPSPPVLVRIVEQWSEQRKGAKVLLVIDVSGSMGDEAGGGETKLELAKRAAIDALDQFKGDDLVALRIFSTNISRQEPTDYVDLVGFGRIAENRELIASKIRSLIPTEGTPLYTVAQASYERLKAEYDPARINAVLLLTDGQNEDPRNKDERAMLTALRAGSEGQSSQPVRIFTIAYGAGADQDVLKRIAEATNAAAYDASDPRTIEKVFHAVVSNF